MYLNESKLTELEYVIIPGRLHDRPDLEHIHSQAFLYWKAFWEDVFVQNGCPGHLNDDAFLRQNMICLLKNKNEIAGMHLYSFYNMNSPACQNHSYMKNSFNDYYLNSLSSAGVKYALSLEYLTVNPSWRKKHLGLSLGNVLLGLSNYVLKSINYDASIAPCRSDVGVTEMIRDIGGDVVVSGIEMHKTECDLIVIHEHKAKDHANEAVTKWVNNYWVQRTDHTEYTLVENYKHKHQNEKVA